MKKYVVVSLVMLLGLLVAACSSPPSSSPAAAASSTSAAATNTAPAGNDLTQTNDEAMVTVEVTPLNLTDQAASSVDFKIVLDTHSVDLSYDLTTIATLSNDTGEKVQPAKWDGPAGGGHHREGALSFPQLKQRGQTLTLTLRGIADVPERTFNWKVN
ncbi:hypothetical protein ANAEL_02586 [Anaerolineales bacterium]|nr:hypothetical protein ANAEL_02586 [Anaerolineales bacterium]